MQLTEFEGDYSLDVICALW